MKSVKVLLGTVLCLAMLSGQAMATTLTFDNVTNLGTYGQAMNVEFLGDWNLATVNGNTQLLELSFTDTTDAALGFAGAPIEFESLKYSYYGNGIAKSSASIIGLDTYGINHEVTLTPILNAYFFPSDWAGLLLKKITFSLTSGTLLVDEVKYTATPLPGAAVLVFSGLLGLVGLRRRQIV